MNGIRREAIRTEDMSARGRLRVMQQADGDIIVAVQSEENGLLQRGYSVEFCTIGAGGGRSPRTMAALVALMDAIDADNTGIGAAEQPAAEPELLPLPKSSANGDNTTDFHGRMFKFTDDDMQSYARAHLRGEYCERQEADARRWRFWRQKFGFGSGPPDGIWRMSSQSIDAPDYCGDLWGEDFCEEVDRVTDASIDAAKAKGEQQ